MLEASKAAAGKTESNGIYSTWELGLSRAAGSRLHFRNLFTHEDEGIFSECFMTKLPAHGCAMYRLSPVGGRE